MKTAVVTIVAGRHRHLRRQQLGLLRSDRLPDVYVVVSMGDSAAVTQTQQGPLSDSDCAVSTLLIAGDGPLPLAAARNAGAMEALRAGADQLIFLDVDCIPSATLIDSYRQSVAAWPTPALHCGVVRYLGAQESMADLGALQGLPHPARPVPAPGELVASAQWKLFWSLSFAVSAATWHRLDGFHEGYAGYGAEDTDFGYAAHLAGVDLVWVGGAEAHHQYHPSESLPVAHLDDILRNATLFHDRWGFWPMVGWLEGFQEAGLARYDRSADIWSK